MTAITYAIPVSSILDYQVKPFEDHLWPAFSALLNIFNPTSNDQRLGGAGDNDRRSKRFVQRCALRTFPLWWEVETLMIQ